MVTPEEKVPTYRGVDRSRPDYITTVYADHAHRRTISRGAEISRNLSRCRPPKQIIRRNPYATPFTVS
jgi:hypothetical protein